MGGDVVDLTPTADEVLEDARLSQEEELRVAYDELVRDKRDVDTIPCYEWRTDGPGGTAYCHCNQVPGNGWGATAPHNDSNRLGKPWCVAHQSTECEELHAAITFDQYATRMANRTASS